MDLNENPEGLSQDFINEVLEAVTPEFVAQYPETLEFMQVLAVYHGTDIEHICLTYGSSEVGWPEGIKMVQKLCTPHNVNAFAMLFAKKIIQKPGIERGWRVNKCSVYTSS